MAAALMVLCAPGPAKGESVSVDVNGTASLGANTGVTTFSGTGTGTSTPFGAITSFTTSGTVDTSGANGFSGTMVYDFGSGNDLDTSFSVSSGLNLNFPATITGGTGIFNDATGTITVDIKGFPTSTTTADFTLTGTGNVSGPNLGSSPSAVPEPASLLLAGVGAALALLIRRVRTSSLRG